MSDQTAQVGTSNEAARWAAAVVIRAAGVAAAAFTAQPGWSQELSSCGDADPDCSGWTTARASMAILDQAIQHHEFIVLGGLLLLITWLVFRIRSALTVARSVAERQLAVLEEAVQATRDSTAAADRAFQELTRAIVAARLVRYKLGEVDAGQAHHPSPTTVTLWFEFTNQGRSRARLLRANGAVRVNNEIAEHPWFDQVIWLAPGETFRTTYTFELRLSAITRSTIGDRVPILVSLGLVYGDGFLPQYAAERFCWIISTGEQAIVPETVFDARSELASLLNA